MQEKRIAIIEICMGLFLITFGSILWWWSKTLLWILIYPPPLAKWIIEISSFVFLGLGILLMIDGTRRFAEEVSKILGISKAFFLDERVAKEGEFTDDVAEVVALNLVTEHYKAIEEERDIDTVTFEVRSEPKTNEIFVVHGRD